MSSKWPLFSYGGETQPKSSLSRNRTPSVLRVTQNPSGKVIFVKKAPRKHSVQRKKSQRTNNGTFEFSTFFRETSQKFPQRSYFFNFFCWQNSRQEHNLKLTPRVPYLRSSRIWRNSDLVNFGAPHSNLNPGFRSLTGELFLGRVLGHGRAVVGQKWPVLGRYFQISAFFRSLWACFIGLYSGKRQPKCSLSRNRTPSVLRVIQNPSGNVIFVKKPPWKPIESK